MVQDYSYIQCHDLLANRFIRIIVVELLFRKTAAFLCNTKYCTQTYWTILTLQGCLLLPKKYAAIISGSLNRRACLA